MIHCPERPLTTSHLCSSLSLFHRKYHWLSLQVVIYLSSAYNVTSSTATPCQWLVVWWLPSCQLLLIPGFHLRNSLNHSYCLVQSIGFILGKIKNEISQSCPFLSHPNVCSYWDLINFAGNTTTSLFRLTITSSPCVHNDHLNNFADEQPVSALAERKLGTIQES